MNITNITRGMDLLDQFRIRLIKGRSDVFSPINLGLAHLGSSVQNGGRVQEIVENIEEVERADEVLSMDELSSVDEATVWQ